MIGSALGFVSYFILRNCSKSIATVQPQGGALDMGGGSLGGGDYSGTLSGGSITPSTTNTPSSPVVSSVPIPTINPVIIQSGLTDIVNPVQPYSSSMVSRTLTFLPNLKPIAPSSQPQPILSNKPVKCGIGYVNQEGHCILKYPDQITKIQPQYSGNNAIQMVGMDGSISFEDKNLGLF